jgi:hypothetical protein
LFVSFQIFKGIKSYDNLENLVEARLSSFQCTMLV